MSTGAFNKTIRGLTGEVAAALVDRDLDGDLSLPVLATDLRPKHASAPRPATQSARSPHRVFYPVKPHSLELHVPEHQLVRLARSKADVALSGQDARHTVADASENLCLVGHQSNG